MALQPLTSSPAADDSCTQQQQDDEATHTQSYDQSVISWISPLCSTQNVLHPAGEHLPLHIHHRAEQPLQTHRRGKDLVCRQVSGVWQPGDGGRRVSLHLTLQPAGGAVWVGARLNHREAQDLRINCEKSSKLNMMRQSSRICDVKVETNQQLLTQNLKLNIPSGFKMQSPVGRFDDA